MSKTFYSPEIINVEFKIGGLPVKEKYNSFSTQPKMGCGKLTRKGLYGDVDPHILELLQKEYNSQPHG